MACHPAPFDVSTCASASSRRCAPWPNPVRPCISTMPETCVEACTDRQMLSNVVSNLLSNAIENTRPGPADPPAHRHHERNAEHPGGGPGHQDPGKDQVHLFERFFRAGNP